MLCGKIRAIGADFKCERALNISSGAKDSRTLGTTLCCANLLKASVRKLPTWDIWSLCRAHIHHIMPNLIQSLVIETNAGYVTAVSADVERMDDSRL